jgi:hypothetical protein
MMAHRPRSALHGDVSEKHCHEPRSYADGDSGERRQELSSGRKKRDAGHGRGDRRPPSAS